MNTAPLHFLYTNVGRGHPFYLDGIVHSLKASTSSAPVISISDVFSESTGLSLAAWRLARGLYRHGSSPGPAHRLYSMLRKNSDYNKPGVMLQIMGRSIRSKHMNAAETLIVAHPTLVAMLKGHNNLVYQHGELITPREAIVLGADTVFVPTSNAAKLFLQAGYLPSQLLVTGLCVEPELVEQSRHCFENRLARMSGQGPLTGAFYSSGAEPRHHVHKLVTAAVAARTCGLRVLVFAVRNGSLQRETLLAFKAAGIEIQTHSPASDPVESDCALLLFATREEENAQTSRMYSQFDFLVTPAHERTNWAMGLGLPAFTLQPNVGPYSLKNESLMLEAGVAIPLANPAECRRLPELVQELKSSGRLAAMARSGWQPDNIGGFRIAAEYLAGSPKRPPEAS